MSRGLGVVIVVADAFSLLVVAAQIAANGAGLTPFRAISTATST